MVLVNDPDEKTKDLFNSMLSSFSDSSLQARQGEVYFQSPGESIAALTSPFLDLDAQVHWTWGCVEDFQDASCPKELFPT